MTILAWICRKQDMNVWTYA